MLTAEPIDAHRALQCNLVMKVVSPDRPQVEASWWLSTLSATLSLHRIRKPVIATVDSWALAAGLESALACDLFDSACWRCSRTCAAARRWRSFSRWTASLLAQAAVVAAPVPLA